MHTFFCGALIDKCGPKKTVIKREQRELPAIESYKSQFIFYSLQSGRFPSFPGGRELRNKSGRFTENPGGLAGIECFLFNRRLCS